MVESFSFDVEPKVGKEHEELGGVYFEPVIVDSTSEPTKEEAANPIDVEDDLLQ